MKNKFKLLIVWAVLLGTVSLYAQSYQKDWENLLMNNRKTVLERAKKINDKHTNIEGLLLKQTALAENGIFYKTDKDFLKNFVKKQDFEYYLYAFWKDPFLFQDESRLNNFKFERISFLEKQTLKKPQIYNSVNYSYAMSAKLLGNDYDAYVKSESKIDAVRDWQFCGVFENLNNSGINTPYPPEKKAYSKEPFNANSNGRVNWFNIPATGHKEAYQTFYNYSEYGNGINYAQSFVTVNDDTDAYVRLGAKAAIKVWADDVLIFEQDRDRKTDLDAYTIKIHLPAGTHRILVKTTNDSEGYFILRLTDAQGRGLKNLTYSATYKPYMKADSSVIRPELLPNEFETYFEQKVKEYPDNVFYQYALIKTYLRSFKANKAQKVLSDLMKKYPKSSMLRLLQTQINDILDESNKNKEIFENIKNDDPDYYFVQLLKLSKPQKMFRKDIKEMEKDLEKIKKSTDQPVIHYTVELFKYLKLQDINKIREVIDRLTEFTQKNGYLSGLIQFSGYYAQLFKMNDKTEKILQDVIKRYPYYSPAYTNLIDLYSDENKDKKVQALYDKLLEKNPMNLDGYFNFARYLYKKQKPSKALPYAEKALKLFPYSFSTMELKGEILQQLNKKREAIRWYEKALQHNSADMDLRDKLFALKGITDPLKKVAKDEKAIYDYIKKNRGKEHKDEYGIHLLYRQINYLVYSEGGYKKRSISVYEVTSSKGAEQHKEYNLGL